MRIRKGVNFNSYICVIYETRKTVFDHISKHWEEIWKYDMHWSISTNFKVLENVPNTVLSWYTLLNETKEKMEN